MDERLGLDDLDVGVLIGWRRTGEVDPETGADELELVFDASTDDLRRVAQAIATVALYNGEAANILYAALNMAEDQLDKDLEHTITDDLCLDELGIEFENDKEDE